MVHSVPIKVLVVDDSQATRRIIRESYLNSGEYHVAEAGDGAEALTLLERERPEIVLIDLQMPGVDGFTVLETVTRRYPECAPIVISATRELSDAVRVMEMGAWGYIEKSENMTGLEGAFARALAATRLRRDKIQQARQIEESERRYRELLSSLPQPIFETDAMHAITYVNDIGLEVSGYTRAELRAMKSYQLVAAEDRERLLANARKVWSGELHGGVEYTLQRKDATTLPVMVYSTPMRAGDGVEVGMRVIAVDISELKHKERELRRQEYLVRHVLDSTPEGMLLIGEDGIIIYLNETARRLLGLASSDPVGDHFGYPLLLSETAELEIPADDGSTLVVGMKTTAIEWQGRKAYLVVLGNITRQKARDEEGRIFRERLELLSTEADVGIWEWEPPSGRLTYDRRWAESFGYAEKELQPPFRGWERFAHPGDAALVRRVIEEHLQGHTPFYRVEYRFRTKAGGYRPIREVGRVIRRDADGKVLQIYGIHRIPAEQTGG